MIDSLWQGISFTLAVLSIAECDPFHWRIIDAKLLDGIFRRAKVVPMAEHLPYLPPSLQLADVGSGFLSSAHGYKSNRQRSNFILTEVAREAIQRWRL